ncbi:MAG TPA: YsnF/AvaK domain-containing protein [Nitrososphaera sp.]|nr:YsnF/AvaK domain-containing protein [Nitrososphaera sp.]
MTSSADQQEPLPASSTLDLGRIIGKNVKTVDHQDVGKVVTALESEKEAAAIIIIISSEAVQSNHNYRIPENLVQGFDGPDLMLSIPRAELGEYEIQDIHSYAAQLRNVEAERKMGEEQEIIVPIIEEKLHVSKKVITDEATIIKEPVTETKIIGVSVMHEELVLEKRPPTLAAEEDNNTTVSEKPPPKNTRTQIRIPLIHEEIRIKKGPYVKEEVVISKKPRTETKTVTDLVINEKVDTINNTVTQSS